MIFAQLFLGLILKSKDKLITLQEETRFHDKNKILLFKKQIRIFI